MRLTTEARVGAVTVIGLLLLGYIIVHLGGFTFGDKGYPVQAVFGQVNGLKEGNAVRYAGVDVGRVQAVQVMPEGVKVTLMINPGVKIPEGSRFTISTDGLLGEKFISIVPPGQSSGFIPPNAVVRGEDPGGMEKLITNADKVMTDLHKLVLSLNEVLGDDKVKAALKDSALNAKEITASLNQFSAALARMAQNNEQDVKIMVSNLTAMSASLRDVTARVDRLIANVDNNGQTAGDLRETVHNLKTTSMRIEKMAATLEGVVTDPDTTKNIKATLQNAREVTEKANTMLTKVSQIKTETSVEMLYNTDTSKYQSNADLRISTSPQDFAVIGATNIGEGSKLNLQMGKGGNVFAGRAGVIEGKAGVGVDAKLTDSMKLSVDAYDPNDLRVKLRAQYQVAPNTFIVGQTTNVNKEEEKNTFVGVRQSF